VPSRETDAPSRESVVGKGKTVAPRHHGSVTMTTVCTCNPDVNWIRFIVERVSERRCNCNALMDLSGFGRRGPEAVTVAAHC